MRLSPHFFAAVLSCTFSLLSPRALYSQDFFSIDRDLSELETLIHDTLTNSEVQQKQLEDLQKNLAESGELIGNYESIIVSRQQRKCGFFFPRRKTSSHGERPNGDSRAGMDAGDTGFISFLQSKKLTAQKWHECRVAPEGRRQDAAVSIAIRRRWIDGF
jgi:hypothetical protein